MRSKFLLGVDIGTQGTKALLIDLGGGVVSSAYKEYEVIHPRPGWAEQWPQVWEEAVYVSINECLQQARLPGKSVAAVGLAGLFGGSGVPVDRKYSPLRPCIIWLDRRAVDETAWIKENVDVEKITRITGNFVDAYFGFPKILWIKRREPDVWLRTYKLLPPTTYIAFKLTNRIAIDFSTAGNIGGVFDIKEMNWSDELCSELSIPPDILPERITPSTEIVGEITLEAAKRCGLAAGTPVVLGGVDAPVATLAAGAINAGENVAITGTSTVWGVLCERNVIKHYSPNFITVPYVIDPARLLYVAAGTDTSGGLLRWFRDQFAQLEVERGKEMGKTAYALLDAEAAKIPAGAEGLLVLPYFMGERAPLWDPLARGVILGLTLFHTKAHIYRALLEAIGNSLRYCIEEATAAGFPVENKCRIVGGLAKSTVCVQIFADIVGRMIVVSSPDIGAPFGAALLAGLGIGAIDKVNIVREWVTAQYFVTPNSTLHAIYNKYFGLFKQLYETTKELIHLLADWQIH